MDRKVITAEEEVTEDVVGVVEDEGGGEGGGAIEILGLESAGWKLGYPAHRDGLHSVLRFCSRNGLWRTLHAALQMLIAL